MRERTRQTYTSLEIGLMQEENEQLKRRLEKAIEYIKEKYEMTLKDSMAGFLDHDEMIEKKRLLHILAILQGEENV